MLPIAAEHPFNIINQIIHIPALKSSSERPLHLEYIRKKKKEYIPNLSCSLKGHVIGPSVPGPLWLAMLWSFCPSCSSSR